VIGAWVIMLANVLDVITTQLVLDKGGAELNPIADFLIENRLLWVAKFLIPCWILLFAYIGRSRQLRVISHLTAAVWFVAGLYSFTVLSNTLYLLFRY
jgi:hypothetical protein